MCKVIDSNGSKNFFGSEQGTRPLFQVPVNFEVGCLIDEKRGANEAVVVIWVPESNITTDTPNNLLTFDSTLPFQAFLGFELPFSDSSKEVNLLQDADDWPIERTGRKHNNYVEVFIQGWMVRAVLEEIP
jgi:hypothetical protein